MGWEVEGGGWFKRTGTCVYLWLIHVSRQELTQYCKAIILQLKILKNYFKKDKEYYYKGEHFYIKAG